MNPSDSTTLLFRLSDEDTMRELVVRLSQVFHVVPAALADTTGHVLSVEVDDVPDLLDEVRAIVAEADAASAEIHRQDG